jgi:hypothetical protein
VKGNAWGFLWTGTSSQHLHRTLLMHCCPSRTDPEECTHKPWTNPRPKPKSAGPAAAAKAPADDEQEVVEEFVALLDDSAAAEQRQPTRPGSAVAAAGAARSPKQQQQQRSASAQRIGSATRNADLDWEEFIERQSRHIGRVEQKVACVAARERSEASPEVCGRQQQMVLYKNDSWSVNSTGQGRATLNCFSAAHNCSN